MNEYTDHTCAAGPEPIRKDGPCKACPAPAPVRNGWFTSIGANGKGHLYRDGVTVCAPRVVYYDAWSRPVRATTDEDHICRYCSRDGEPRVCLCWSCKMKRGGKYRP